MNPTIPALIAASAAATFLLQTAPPGPAKGIATGVLISLAGFWLPLALAVDWLLR